MEHPLFAELLQEHSQSTSRVDLSPVKRVRFQSSISHNCKESTLKLADLVKYSQKIEHHWREIAFQMDVRKEEVDIIDTDHLYIQDKCCVMFTAWLKRTTSPCWCKFMQALSVYCWARECCRRSKNAFNVS